MKITLTLTSLLLSLAQAEEGYEPNDAVEDIDGLPGPSLSSIDMIVPSNTIRSSKSSRTREIISRDTKTTRSSSDASICGDSSDPCMNEENWLICRALVEQCHHVSVLESCPIQFGCDDSLVDDTKTSFKSALHDDKDDHGDDSDTDEPNACVSLLVYKDKKCKEGPVRALTFPTWTKSGSSCYHDATMPNYSVKDQYCDPGTGSWHESVYPGSTDCRVSWINSWWYPIHMTFSRDTCVQGFKLDNCLMGPCHSNDVDEIEVLNDNTSERVGSMIA